MNRSVNIVYIVSLGILTMGVGSLIAAVYLTTVNQPVPDPLWGVIGSTPTGLLGILAQWRPTGEAQAVQVVNEGPAEAVPVDAG